MDGAGAPRELGSSASSSLHHNHLTHITTMLPTSQLSYPHHNHLTNITSILQTSQIYYAHFNHPARITTILSALSLPILPRFGASNHRTCYPRKQVRLTNLVRRRHWTHITTILPHLPHHKHYTHVTTVLPTWQASYPRWLHTPSFWCLQPCYRCASRSWYEGIIKKNAQDTKHCRLFHPLPVPPQT